MLEGAWIAGHLLKARRYGYAIGLVTAALLVTFLLQKVFSIPLWFSFLAAVMASSWFGGRGPGWLAVLLSTLAVDRFFLPGGIHGAINREDLPFLLAFVICAVVASWFSSWRTDIERSLKEARDLLEARVKERTFELERTNATLLVEMAERKRAQEAFSSAQAELAHVNRVMTIGELTASIAHELSQPLVAVVTSAGACERWLANEPPDLEKASAAIARIGRAAGRASEIVNSTRALFRKGVPEARSVNINDLIEETIPLLQGEASRRNVSIRTELDANLPFGVGDRTHLQQVLVNLMMNGIDAMEFVQGRPAELHIMSRILGGKEILITIQDSGTGLNAEDMEAIFQPFFTTKSNGLGMGLSICRSIIESHGGRLWVTPGASFGATFQFTLPVKPPTIESEVLHDDAGAATE